MANIAKQANLSYFDTVDSMILLNTLKFYRIRGDEFKLFASYLTERTQYTQIYTFNSPVLKSLNCSVIQGGKLSGLLYTIYTNEIPVLYKLLYEDILTNITGDIKLNKDNTKHTITNIVGDTTNIIAFKSVEKNKIILD